MIDNHSCLVCGAFKNKTVPNNMSICACGFWVRIEGFCEEDEEDRSGWLIYKVNDEILYCPDGLLLVMNWDNLEE